MPTTKTPEQKKREAEAERDRAARRRRVDDRLKAMPQGSRDAVRRDAQRREAEHKGPRVTAVQWLEEALDAFETKAGPVFPKPSGARGDRRVPASTDEPPAKKAARRPKGPREKSTPKEKGRPTPETKEPDKLAADAKLARGGDAAIKATVAVTVPTGTAYCKSCDQQKPEAEFWPVNRTEKSKRRHTCRPCYNAAWAKWSAEKKAKVTA